jgi:hypothetical protein
MSLSHCLEAMGSVKDKLQLLCHQCFPGNAFPHQHVAFTRKCQLFRKPMFQGWNQTNKEAVILLCVLVR